MQNIQIGASGNFKITIDYLSNETFNTQLEAEESQNGKIVECRRKGITSDYVITNVKTFGVNLTEFDRAVLNACIAEQADGNEFTTAGRIYRRLGGSYNLGNDMRKAILDSIERLASVRISVEMEKAQTKLGYGAEKDKSTLNGYLLPTESIETKINGQTADAIHIFNKGMIFGIADMKNQIITCDQNLLEAPIRHSERGIALNHYIVRRTLTIKGSHASRNQKITPLRNVISFDDMLDKCGLKNVTRRQRQQVKETTEKILDFLVDNGVIKSFAFEVGAQGKIRSIILEL